MDREGDPAAGVDEGDAEPLGVGAGEDQGDALGLAESADCLGRGAGPVA